MTTPAVSRRIPRYESWLHIALIVLVGFGYRATFIAQGFNATDEGWLESVARRITFGQVPYRDFRFAFPPVSIYKEAAFQAIFGDAYTLLFARWVFVGEVTLGSVLTYLIISRFVHPRLALLATLPTVFMTVLSYYFANYTYDADVLMLGSAALLAMTPPNRRWPAAAAGVTAALAVMAKPPYLAFVVLVPALALAMRALVRPERVHPALVGVYARWQTFLVTAAATFAGVLALFAVAGAAQPYVEQAYLESTLGAKPFTYLLWQDLPSVFSSRELKLFAAVAALLLAASLPWFRRIGPLLVLAVPAGLFFYWLRYVHGAIGFLPMATGLLLVISGVALVIALAARAPWWKGSRHAADLLANVPTVELVLLALTLQYLAQFTNTGVAYSYLGTFLSVPVAVLLLYGLVKLGMPAAEKSWRIWAPASVAAGLLAVWIVVGSFAYVQDHVYFDAPRSQLTATFTTSKLAGISSNPANVDRIQTLVAIISHYSSPGDPILAMPDFGCIYYLTDRTNPTGQDWFLDSDPRFLPPSEIDAVIRDMQRNPPKVVILETYSEFDWSRLARPDYVFDYPASPLAPVYSYLVQHYRLTATAGDIQVLVPQS